MEILPTKAYGATGSVFNGLQPGTVERTPLDNQEVAMHRRSIAGSIIGDIAETREVLEFCAEHHILPEVEMIKMQDINDAFDKMNDKEVCFRHVIYMASLKDAQ